MAIQAPNQPQQNNPLHGFTLQQILELLVEHQGGFAALAKQIPLKCFSSNPSIKSSLTFLRKTPWARTQVEELFIKLKLYQKAEGTEPKILEFPKLFLKDLNKQKILEHLDKYSFGLIDEKLTQNIVIRNLSRYASLRLELRYNSLKNMYDNILGKPDAQKLVANGSINWKKEWEESEKLEDLYISCKIAFHQKKFNEVLWKLFTINENLLKVEVDKLLNVDMSDFHRGNITPNRENTALVDFLNSKNPNYVSELRNNGIYLNNPSRFMYKKIIEIENTNSTYNLHSNISKLIEKLASNRNKIAHGLGFIDKDKISREMGFPLEELFIQIDVLFGIVGFGRYDEIKHVIRKLL